MNKKKSAWNYLHLAKDPFCVHPYLEKIFHLEPWNLVENCPIDFSFEHIYHCFTSISYVVFINLTHWGRVTHICVGKLSIIVSDNGLSPGRRQAIIWTNAGIVLIGALGTNVSENFDWNLYIFIEENAFENVVCEMASILSRPQCVKCKGRLPIPPKSWILAICCSLNFM